LIDGRGLLKVLGGIWENSLKKRGLSGAVSSGFVENRKGHKTEFLKGEPVTWGEGTLGATRKWGAEGGYEHLSRGPFTDRGGKEGQKNPGKKISGKKKFLENVWGTDWNWLGNLKRGTARLYRSNIETTDEKRRIQRGVCKSL